jgi:hypothetical protein
MLGAGELRFKKVGHGAAVGDDYWGFAHSRFTGAAVASAQRLEVHQLGLDATHVATGEDDMGRAQARWSQSFPPRRAANK